MNGIRSFSRLVRLFLQRGSVLNRKQRSVPPPELADVLSWGDEGEDIEDGSEGGEWNDDVDEAGLELGTMISALGDNNLNDCGQTYLVALAGDEGGDGSWEEFLVPRRRVTAEALVPIPKVGVESSGDVCGAELGLPSGGGDTAKMQS